jgi:hypothetical protein
MVDREDALGVEKLNAEDPGNAAAFFRGEVALGLIPPLQRT